MRNHYKKHYHDNTSDLVQLAEIIKLINLLMTYHTNKMDGINPDDLHSLDTEEIIAYEHIVLHHCRNTLTVICIMFYCLSDELRSVYKHLLLPELMRWESIGRLGWIVNQKPTDITVSILSKSEFAREEEESFTRYFNEMSQHEFVLRPAVFAIIRDDLPKLKALASHMLNYAKLNLNVPVKIQPIKLLAISAFVKRLGDGASLKELLELTANHHPDEYAKIKKTVRERKLTVRRIELCIYNHDSKMQRYATLRRLQRIGELITGKNLSLNLSTLSRIDPSTAWQALVDLRDGISHPEERRNKELIELILNDNKTLDRIVNHELSELSNHIHHIIHLRDKMIPQYNKSYHDFWESIYQFEKDNESSVNNNNASGIVENPRVSPEEMHFFLTALKDNATPDDAFNTWRKILNGSASLPKNKREVGDLMKSLPPKGQPESPERARFNRCKEIANTAIYPKTDKSTRIEARKADQQRAKEKQLEQANALQGLDNIRRLALLFTMCQGPSPKREEIITGAIQAAQNIIEFLENKLDIKILPGLQFDKPFADQLINAFETDSAFAQAIEINFAHLLQYMEVVKNYPGSEQMANIGMAYRYLKETRNYVIHGNLVIDIEIHKADDQEIKSSRSFIISLFSTFLSTKLLPSLLDLREFYERIGNIASQFLDVIYKIPPSNNQLLSDKRLDPRIIHHKNLVIVHLEEENEFILHRLCQYGVIGFIKLTALVKTKELEVYNLEGLTPLLASVKYNQKECAVLLLCLGAKLDVKTKYSEQTV